MYLKLTKLIVFRIDEWDHRLFGFSDTEAEITDPQQRMVLDCVHMALEDGGITRKDIEGTDTAVYMGTCTLNDESIHYVPTVANCTLVIPTRTLEQRQGYTFRVYALLINAGDTHVPKVNMYDAYNSAMIMVAEYLDAQ